MLRSTPPRFSLSIAAALFTASTCSPNLLIRVTVAGCSALICLVVLAMKVQRYPRRVVAIPTFTPTRSDVLFLATAVLLFIWLLNDHLGVRFVIALCTQAMFGLAYSAVGDHLGEQRQDR